MREERDHRTDGFEIMTWAQQKKYRSIKCINIFKIDSLPPSLPTYLNRSVTVTPAAWSSPCPLDLLFYMHLREMFWLFILEYDNHTLFTLASFSSMPAFLKNVTA